MRVAILDDEPAELRRVDEVAAARKPVIRYVFSHD